MIAAIQLLHELRSLPPAERAIVLEAALEEHGADADNWHDAASELERAEAKQAVFGPPPAQVQVPRA